MPTKTEATRAGRALALQREYTVTCHCNECRKCQQREYRRARREAGKDRHAPK